MKNVIVVTYPEKISGGWATDAEGFCFFPMAIVDDTISKTIVDVLNNSQSVLFEDFDCDISFDLLPLSHWADTAQAELARCIIDLEQNPENHTGILIAAQKAVNQTISGLAMLGDGSQGTQKKEIKIKKSDFNNSDSLALLTDLCKYPEGVTYNPDRHGRRQPEDLRKALRHKGRYPDAADAIKSKDGTIFLDFGVCFSVVK